MKKTTSNKQAESNFDFTNKNCVYLEENLYSTRETMLTIDFSLSIDYLRSLNQPRYLLLQEMQAYPLVWIDK